MRRCIGMLASVALIGLLLPGAATAAGWTRVPVCHLVGNGAYDLVEVAEPAYYTHLGHGDSAIGDQVPGMDPAWVFDPNCKPLERPLKVLARVWSVDDSGVVHLLARVDDTNYDGMPSGGDTLVLDEYPYFTSDDGPIAYGHFTVTSHAIAWVYTGTVDGRNLSVFSDAGGFQMVDYEPTANPYGLDETYGEYPLGNFADQSFFADGTGGSLRDTTRSKSASPSRPDREIWTVASPERNLIDIEFDFPF